MERLDCMGEERPIKVLTTFREGHHGSHCCLKCHLIRWAEAVCGSKLPMEAQHCLNRSDADTPLNAQPLPSVGALKIEAAGREEIRRAGRVLRGSLGCCGRKSQTEEPNSRPQGLHFLSSILMLCMQSLELGFPPNSQWGRLYIRAVSLFFAVALSGLWLVLLASCMSVPCHAAHSV